MPILYINTGSAANAGDGDNLRTAFTKVNNNFALLSNLTVSTTTQFYDLIPITNNVYNLGSMTNAWSNIYIDNSLVLKDSTVTLNAQKQITIDGIVLSDTYVGTNAPMNYTTGTTWFDTNTGGLFVRYLNGWVQVMGASGGGGSGNLLAVASDVLPSIDAAYNIGSLAKTWNDLHVGQIYFGTATLSIDAFNTLTINGSPLIGSIGPQGPQGPTGPGANQSLNTTSTVVFSNLTVTNAAVFEGTIAYRGNMIDLHVPPNGTWTFDDSYDIGFRFRHYLGTDTAAGLVVDAHSDNLQYFYKDFTNLTTGTYTGTYGAMELSELYLKGSGLVFPDNSLQSQAFTGSAQTADYATTATNVNGGTVNGSVVNGTTSTTQVGYLVVPQIRIDGVNSYTLNISDQGKHIYCVTATSQAIVIPTHTAQPLPIGTAVTLIQNGTGTVLVQTSTGVTLVLAGAEETGDRTLFATALVTLLKVENNTWFISGTGII